ncbi:hypothetical protein [Roseovarius sp. D22-M7]|uniref:hypothetical protein n=1 Tax=Roseovarius sp. D22-M7 TaxID=3127116 RepID=UPI00301008BD
MTRTLLAFLALVIILSTYYGFASPQNLGFFPSVSADTRKIFLSAMAMVLGIFCGSLHRQWANYEKPMSRSSISRALRSPDLWRSMLLSPILFSGVYVAAKQQPDYVLAFIFAFQTGFFCDKILEDRRELQNGNE